MPNIWQRRDCLTSLPIRCVWCVDCSRSYEPIDFLARLFGYAISGERTPTDFFERLAPFATAFMALFGRKGLPHRSSLSRDLSDVDRACVEAFRTLFEQHSEASGWTNESIGGIWDRRGHRYVVFGIDATRQSARKPALPCDPTLPSPRRRLDAVCAPGFTGRKRGEVVRTRTVALQMHTRQPCPFRDGSAPMLAEAMVTLRGNWLRPFEPSRVTSGSLHALQKSLWFASTGNMVMP